MTDTVLARVAALKTTPTPDLKEMWRDLFETEPPPYNRRFLESRLAYRIQELAYGGLKPETIKRLEALASRSTAATSRCAASATDQTDRRHAADPRIAGRRARVTVRDDGYEYQGRPYKSLSAIARAITGTRWNGLVFFGLKNQKGRT